MHEASACKMSAMQGPPHHPFNHLLLQTETAQVSNAHSEHSKLLSEDDVLKVPLGIEDTFTFNNF